MFSMNYSDSFRSLDEALDFVSLASGLTINKTSFPLDRSTRWSSAIHMIPLMLGFIGLLFNILALLIFTASRTFRQSAFRCFIYAYVLVNCASIVTHSWLYLLFYLFDSTSFCKYAQYFQQSLSTTSLWFMVLLSFERSLTFTRPLTVKQLSRTHLIYGVLLSVLGFCFFIHLDELIFVEIKAFRWVNFAYGLCSIKRLSVLSADRVRIVQHVCSFILPFILNTILDSYICYRIFQRRKHFSKNSKPNQRQRRRRSKISLANEITLTLLCQSLYLLIAFFPARLYYSLISFKTIDIHDRDDSKWPLFIRLNLLVYLAFSPTLYVILSPTLRREISIYLCHPKKQRKHHTSNGVKKENIELINSARLLQVETLNYSRSPSFDLSRKNSERLAMLSPHFKLLSVSKSDPCFHIEMSETRLEHSSSQQ